MTITIINRKDGGYSFWNRSEHYEVYIEAGTIKEAKKIFRESFDLIGKSVKWVIA